MNMMTLHRWPSGHNESFVIQEYRVRTLLWYGRWLEYHLFFVCVLLQNDRTCDLKVEPIFKTSEFSKCTCGFHDTMPRLELNAGSRTDFWGKNRAIFSGELFSGEEFLPRTAFSGKKCRSILSNQVISWNGSSADRCPLGREFFAKTCSLLGGFLLSV